MPEYDTLILDVGGDELVILTGLEATPENAQRIVEGYNRDRAARFDAAPEPVQMFHLRWMTGQHIYAKRTVPNDEVGELTVWLSAPGLPELLTSERRLGAEAGELEHLVEMLGSGMIHGLFASVLAPEGEPGSVHVCDVEEVSASEYDLAKRLGWRVS